MCSPLLMDHVPGIPNPVIPGQTASTHFVPQSFLLRVDYSSILRPKGWPGNDSLQERMWMELRCLHDSVKEEPGVESEGGGPQVK